MIFQILLWIASYGVFTVQSANIVRNAMIVTNMKNLKMITVNGVKRVKLVKTIK